MTAESRRTLGGWIWFAAMVGGWIFFFGLVLFSETTLSDWWHELRSWQFLVEGVVWLLLFPLVLATAVWESSWETWVRVGLLCSFALAWSAMFFPRKKAGLRRSAS